MQTEATTSTGHTLVVDRAARRLRVTAGDLGTIAQIPLAEIQALCRPCGVRRMELVAPDAWRIETHEDLITRRPPR